VQLDSNFNFQQEIQAKKVVQNTKIRDL